MLEFVNSLNATLLIVLKYVVPLCLVVLATLSLGNVFKKLDIIIHEKINQIVSVLKGWVDSTYKLCNWLSSTKFKVIITILTILYLSALLYIRFSQ